MTAPVLNAREWLETIVATGAQRSGFAQDALDQLDWYDTQLNAVLTLLADAGVIERGSMPDDLPGLLAMFVHP